MASSQRIDATARPPDRRQLHHVAIVSAPDGILFAAVEPSQEGLFSRLATYVEKKAATMLWPADADRVFALLGHGRAEAAVELYFERVGQRWDQEHLHRAMMEMEP